MNALFYLITYALSVFCIACIGWSVYTLIYNEHTRDNYSRLYKWARIKLSQRITKNYD